MKQNTSVLKLKILSLLLLVGAVFWQPIECFSALSPEESLRELSAEDFKILDATLRLFNRVDLNIGLNYRSETEVLNHFNSIIKTEHAVSASYAIVKGSLPYGTWKIQFASGLIVGVRALLNFRNQYTDIVHILFGYANQPGDESWQKDSWYSHDSLAPFLVRFSGQFDFRNSRMDLRRWVSGLIDLPRKMIVEESEYDSGRFNRYRRNPELAPLEKIYQGAELKWAQDLTQTPRVPIAVIDSGVDYNIPQLRAKILPGWDYVENDDRPFDFNFGPFAREELSHGTGVAVVAAQGDFAQVLPIRLLKSDRLLPDRKFGEKFQAAVELAKNSNVRIVNLSFSSRISDPIKFRRARRGNGMELAIEGNEILNQTSREVLETIRSSPDILFIIASGNEREDRFKDSDRPSDSWDPFIKARLPNIVRVASVDSENNLSQFSVFGRVTIELAALGEYEQLPFVGGKLKEANGTSFAAPLVANIAAEALSINPNLSTRGLIAILKRATVRTPALASKLKWGGYIDRTKARSLARESL